MKRRFISFAKVFACVLAGCLVLWFVLSLIDDSFGSMGSSLPIDFPDTYWISEDGEMYVYVNKEKEVLLFAPDDSDITQTYLLDSVKNGRLVRYHDYPSEDSDGREYSIKSGNDHRFEIDFEGSRTVTFNRVYYFDIYEYAQYLEGEADTIIEANKAILCDPRTAISNAKEAWKSPSVEGLSEYSPYHVYFDKQNGCWLVKTSYHCLNIFGKEFFKSKSANAIIRGSDGKILGSWVNVN